MSILRFSSLLLLLALVVTPFVFFPSHKASAGGNSITGGGSSGRIPKFTGERTLGNSLLHENNGNLGIGSTHPEAKFLVPGGRLAVTANTEGRFGALVANQNGPGQIATFSANGGQDIKMIVRSDGKVGLGIDAPSSTMHIVGETDDSSTFAMEVENSNQQPILTCRNDGTVAIGATNSNFYRLRVLGGGVPIPFNVESTNNVNLLGVHNSGHVAVGVGVSSALGRFQVNGLGTDSSTYAMWVGDNASSPLFRIRDDGQVEVMHDLHVGGTLTKAAGSFRIDHPLDPKNKDLYHSFVESPEMLNVYDGTVVLDQVGSATVALPAYFEALNRDFRYQLTPIGAPAPRLHVAEEVCSGAFRIAGGVPKLKVSWQVTGVRQDAWANANRIPTEIEKNIPGVYLHPELYGQNDVSNHAD